jgi:hypothetical protein
MKIMALANKMSVFSRFGSGFSLVGVALGLALTGLGCSEAQEGDRCNPDLSHNDCNSGLICTVASQGPPTTGEQFSPNAPCAETYCCPASGDSTNPNCQPGCNGGAASICAADPSLSYVCAVAEALEGGEPLPAFDSGVPDAEPDAEPDEGADAPADGPDGG